MNKQMNDDECERGCLLPLKNENDLREEQCRSKLTLLMEIVHREGIINSDTTLSCTTSTKNKLIDLIASNRPLSGHGRQSRFAVPSLIRICYLLKERGRIEHGCATQNDPNAW